MRRVPTSSSASLLLRPAPGLALPAGLAALPAVHGLHLLKGTLRLPETEAAGFLGSE